MSRLAIAAAALATAALAAPATAAPCRSDTDAISDAKLDGSRVLVCFGFDHRRCWGLDLAARPAWKKLPPTAIPLDACKLPCGVSPPPSTITSSALVTACAPDGTACHTVATPAAVGLEAVTDGALVAAVEDERITVADVRSGKVLATIAPWSHPENQRLWTFRNVRFVEPDRLFAELGDGDTTFARVFTAHTGDTAIDLAGSFDRRAPPVVLGHELALATADNHQLVLVDLQRFTQRTLPLFANPARVVELELLAATPTAIVAIQNETDGSVAISDGKTIRRIPGPPICP